MTGEQHQTWYRHGLLVFIEPTVSCRWGGTQTSTPRGWKCWRSCSLGAGLCVESRPKEAWVSLRSESDRLPECFCNGFGVLTVDLDAECDGVFRSDPKQCAKIFDDVSPFEDPFPNLAVS